MTHPKLGWRRVIIFAAMTTFVGVILDNIGLVAFIDRTLPGATGAGSG